MNNSVVARRAQVIPPDQARRGHLFSRWRTSVQSGLSEGGNWQRRRRDSFSSSQGGVRGGGTPMLVFGPRSAPPSMSEAHALLLPLHPLALARGNSGSTGHARSSRPDPRIASSLPPRPRSGTTRGRRGSHHAIRFQNDDTGAELSGSTPPRNHPPNKPFPAYRRGSTNIRAHYPHLKRSEVINTPL